MRKRARERERGRKGTIDSLLELDEKNVWVRVSITGKGGQA